MEFPISYDSDGRLKSFAKGARTARRVAEERGEDYDGTSIAGQVDESLTIEAQDLEVARDLMERERAELQQFMDDYQAANKLVVLCRRFVYPTLNNVRFDESADSRQLPVKDLFYQLGLGDDKLREVYEFGNLTEMVEVFGYNEKDNPIGYSGRFTKNGRQKLADILQNEITFYQQPESDPIGIDPETFRPQK